MSMPAVSGSVVSADACSSELMGAPQFCRRVTLGFRS